MSTAIPASNTHPLVPSARGVRRTVLAVAAAELIPVPILDTYVQNHARRWFVRTLAEDRALELSDDEVSALADAPLAPVRRAVLWPVKLVLKKVFVVYGLYAMVKEAREVTALPSKLGLAGEVGVPTLEA